ncbi:MAG: hypothetical protein PVF51_13545 [Nitrospirota bacterium]
MMERIVHARLDEQSEQLLERLRRDTGWRDSEIVRRGIQALATLTLAPRKAEIVGLGRFASGVPDLGSAKGHLDGFGRS